MLRSRVGPVLCGAQKQVVFIQVNDGSCLVNLQLVVPQDHPQFEQLGRLSQGSGLKAQGRLTPSTGSGQSLRIAGGFGGGLRRGRPHQLSAAKETP